MVFKNVIKMEKETKNTVSKQQQLNKSMHIAGDFICSLGVSHLW